MQNHHIMRGINSGLRAQSASQLLASSGLTPLNSSAQVDAAVEEAAVEEAAVEKAAVEETAGDVAAEEEAAEDEEGDNMIINNVVY